MPVESDVQIKAVERNNYAGRSWGKSEHPFSMNYAQQTNNNKQQQQRQQHHHRTRGNRRSRTSRVTSAPQQPQQQKIDTNNPPQLFASTGWGPMGK